MWQTRDEEAGRWLAQARADLGDAEYNRAGARHNVACFLSHQAGEKALKAFLFSMPDEDPWGHSIHDLCLTAAQHDGDFGALVPKVSVLDQYYVPTRYPNGLPGGIPSEAYAVEDSDRAIGLARTLLDVVSSKIAGGP